MLEFGKSYKKFEKFFEKSADEGFDDATDHKHALSSIFVEKAGTAF